MLNIRCYKYGISSKNLESLWQRYKVKADPVDISVNQFFESNGVPYLFPTIRICVEVMEWKYIVVMLSCPVVMRIGPIELKCYEDSA